MSEAGPPHPSAKWPTHQNSRNLVRHRYFGSKNGGIVPRLAVITNSAVKDPARVHSEQAVPDLAFLQEDAPQQGTSSLLECGLKGRRPLKADIVEAANIQQRLQV